MSQKYEMSVENRFYLEQKLTRHFKKNHQTKDSPKVVQKVKSSIGFKTFVRTEKESTT